MGLQTLFDRYLMRDDERSAALRLPQYFLDARRRWGLPSMKSDQKNEDCAIEFYNLLSQFGISRPVHAYFVQCGHRCIRSCRPAI